MTNQIVILAAGKGTRMGGEMPKVLVMLKNKPLILHLLHELEKFTQLIKPVIVVGYGADKVKAVVGDEYFYAYQNQQLGTAHALMAAKSKVRAENILVLYGDMPFIKSESLKKLLKLHLGTNSKISMLTASVKSFEHPFESLKSYGRIIRDATGSIQKIVEYKDASDDQKQITEVNPGIYMFNTAWLWPNLEKIKNQNAQGEYYLTDIAALALLGGEKITTQLCDPLEVLGVNSPQDLAVAENL